MQNREGCSLPYFDVKGIDNNYIDKFIFFGNKKAPAYGASFGGNCILNPTNADGELLTLKSTSGNFKHPYSLNNPTSIRSSL